jgi:Male sterility protein
MFYLTSKLPTAVLDKVSKIPGIGSPKMQKDVQTLKFVNEKLGDLYELFAHFTRNEWIYESNQIYELEAMMTKGEREVFFVDPRTFDWATATCLYGKGIEYYMNKQDIYSVDDKTGFLLNKNKFRNFDSIRRAFIENKIVASNPIQIRKEAFASSFI